MARNDGRCLQLDLCRGVEQIGNKNHAHRGIVISHQRFPNAPEFATTREVSGLVDTECGQSANVARLASCLCKNGEDILERLLELRNEIIALKMLIGIPANLTGNEHNSARRRTDAVCIADRRQPAGWMENLN